MSKHDNLAYLRDMQDACLKVRVYVNGFTWDSFAVDGMRQDAVIRQLMVLGEASNRVSQEYRDSHPDIPWQKIKAFRNVMAHEYDRVMPEVVWDVTQKNVPEILKQVESLIEHYEEQEKSVAVPIDEPEQRAIYYDTEDKEWQDDRDDDR
jgi:uncharacterized protein with HEPN domain